MDTNTDPTPFTPVLAPPIAPELPLYPYQQEIVGFLLSQPYALNASFVGSGKTLTSLALCQAVNARRVLIIAPKSVVLQWAEGEIPKWLPNAAATPVIGSTHARRTHYTEYSSGFVVVGYETARMDIEHLAMFEWDVIITDEAHRLANPSTKLYKALKKLKSKRRLALTATPVMNKAEDMFGIMNWLRPGMFGNYYSFIWRYCVKGGYMDRQIVGNKNTKELADKCAPYIIRKTLAEVDLQLPPYTETEIPVMLSPQERKNYDLIVKELLFDIDRAIISKLDNPVMLQTTVVKLGKLFELCDSMELLGESLESSKLEVLKEHLESTLINGQKAIIITRFSRMVGILEDQLKEYRPLTITGATENRAEIIKAFESEGNRKILIGSEAIGQGLNLQV